MNFHVEAGIKQQMNTFELAKIYEQQGYGEDAYKIYAALDACESTVDTRAGLDRTQDSKNLSKKQIYQPGEEDPADEIKVKTLLEEWFGLLNAKHRIDCYKKLKSRL